MTLSEIFDTLPYGPAPESAELANAWLDARGRKFGHFIGGEFVEPAENVFFPTLNPATTHTIAEVAQGSTADVERAARAAKQAQTLWWELGCHERAKYLYALARQIQKHSRLLAVLETLDNGKPIRETRDIDVPLVARHFYHHAGWAQILDTELPGYGPVGVCGQIIPWNFPLLMLAWKIAPALATGNAVILKPAEFTPLTALCFAEICKAVGLPAGVVNIVTGDGETGRLIVEHPEIRKIAFTGSTEVGRIIRKATAGSGKKLSLELGGKSPFVVFEDADLDSAIEGLVDAIWFNQGQVCCAGSRLLVQESIADRFLQRLKARMENLRVGDPLDKAVDIGAIVAPVQLERITTLVEKGREEGADLFQPSWACPKEGWFYPPTLLTNVSPASTVAQVEIFGPVLVAMTFRTPAEAVALANNTTYGLAASVWSQSLSLALDVAAKIKAGTVWVNSTNLFDAASGFGGYKESGFGREGGKEGLFEYLVPIGSREPEKASRAKGSASVDRRTSEGTALSQGPSFTPIDRTYKLYIGGKQVRPDQGYSIEVLSASRASLGEVARGNRKDVRNAVEAARNAQPAWAAQTGHARAQVLYYVAENLAERRGEFESLIRSNPFDLSPSEELDRCLRALFDFAAWADKYDGSVHGTAFRGVTYTLNEPVGVIGLACPDRPALLPVVTLAAAAVAMGNAVIVLPSQTMPIPAMELYTVLHASDVPAGVVNLISGVQDELSETLAGHDGVDAVWHFGSTEGATRAEALSAGNLKQTWTDPYGAICWSDLSPEFARECLRRATQVKNIWVPIGE